MTNDKWMEIGLIRLNIEKLSLNQLRLIKIANHFNYSSHDFILLLNAANLFKFFQVVYQTA